MDLLTDRFRFWEEIHPRQSKSRYQNRRVPSAIERVNTRGPAFIEDQRYFLRVAAPKNIFPKTEPVREQVHHGHDGTISARSLARFERIAVMGRLVTLLEMEGWERAHSGGFCISCIRQKVVAHAPRSAIPVAGT